MATAPTADASRRPSTVRPRRRSTPTQQLAQNVDRVIWVEVIGAGIVRGIVIAVDADEDLHGGGSLIMRDLDDGYRIIALDNVTAVTA